MQNTFSLDKLRSIFNNMFIKICCLALTAIIIQGCKTASKNNDSLALAYNKLKASLEIIKLPNVRQDYIHQVMYLNEVINKMNTELINHSNLQLVHEIANELNDMGNIKSVGYILLHATGAFQQGYYKLPTHEAPDILGRKAVGTAIFIQYVQDSLKLVDKNLKNTKTGTIENFIELNNTAYKKLVDLTKAYYSQASVVKKEEMNLGFDYEKNFLAWFSKPLSQFYK